MHRVRLSATTMSGSGAVHVAFDVRRRPKMQRHEDVFKGVQSLRKKINPKDNVHLLFEDGEAAPYMAVVERLNESVEEDPARVHAFAFTYCFGPVTITVRRSSSDAWRKRVLLNDLDAETSRALIRDAELCLNVTILVAPGDFKDLVIRKFHQAMNESFVTLLSLSARAWTIW
jgi:hypothetical protein